MAIDGTEIRVSPGRVLKVTAVYDTYWRFAAKRQDLFMRRVSGKAHPWTDDNVIASHRFTNVYRAADRVSQYLIRHVLYAGSQTEDEVFFRALLFKIFNRIRTWKQLIAVIGMPSWKTFDFERYARVFDEMLARGGTVYSAAYIMPSPPFGNPRKHRNHLQLLEHMIRDGAPRKITQAQSLEEVFRILRDYPSFGDFLAYQFTIDLNYSELTNFSEMDFVVAGPGARNGIRKCFTDTAALNEAEIIALMAERAQFEFERLGVSFQTLWGRPLQLIDCQNLFCEIDKYARVVHPEIKGESSRTRIKQRFAPDPEPIQQWYPPKWNLTVPVVSPRLSHQQFPQQQSLAI